MNLYNKLSLLSIPSGYKINRSFNIKPLSSDKDFDFTRSTIATRVNSKGIIEEVASDILRLDYAESLSSPSLLLEPASVNLAGYSEDFSQGWNAGNSTVTTNQTTSPSGDLTADKFIATDTNQPRVEEGFSIPSTNTTFTFSVFVKKISTPYVAIALFDGSDNPFVIFNLDTKSVVSSDSEGSSIKEMSSGWFRISMTQTVLSTDTLNIWKILNSNGSSAFDGVIGEETFIWGAQLEEKPYATSYIPTPTNLSVTRAVDSFTLGGDSSTFFNEGALFYEAKLDQQKVDGTTYTSTISLSDGGTDDRLMLAYNYIETGSINYTFSKMGNVDILGSPVSSSLYPTEYHKVAIKYKAGDYGIFVNGIKEVEDTNSQAVIPLNRINFSSNIEGNFPFFGRVKMVGNISGSISDSELVDFTTIDNTKVALVGPSSVYKSMYIPGMPGNTGVGALDNRVKFNRFENLGQIQKYNSGANGRDSTELIYTVGDISSFPSTGSATGPTGSNYTGTDYDLSLIENLNLVDVNFGGSYSVSADYGTPIGLNILVGSLTSGGDPMDASLLFKLQNLIDLKPDIMVCNIAGVNKYANSGFPSFSGNRQKTQNQLVNASVLHTKIIIDLCRRINCKVVIIDTTSVGRNFDTPATRQLVITNVLAMSQELEAMVTRYNYPESDVVFANVRDGDYGLAGLAYTSGDDIYLTKDEYVVSDNLHYNEAGYEIYANIVYKAIERLETLNNRKYLKNN